MNPQDYVGTYYSQELQVAYVVKAVDGKLILEEPRATSMPINAYQPDIFRPAGPTYVGRMKFTRDEIGDLNAVLVSGALANDILFKKVELPPS